MVPTLYSKYQKYIGHSSSRKILVCAVLALIFFLSLLHQQFGVTTNHLPILQQDAWDYRRDGKNLVFGTEKCERVFPGLFQELERSKNLSKWHAITPATLDSIQLRNGCMRVLLYDQALYVIAAEGKIYSRGIATLLALQRAVTSSPDPLPNIEFIVSTDDRLDPLPLWSYARATHDDTTWLMPDFGFWSWPETKVGSYGEVQRKAEAMEESTNNPSGHAWAWKDKKKELFWRGATMNLEVRKKLIELTANKEWADVKEIKWRDEDSMKNDLKTMDEHCQWRFLAHVEGNSYSGRLKYLQNCRSVIFAHSMEWIQHYTRLMRSSGTEQNYVEVRRDLGDLEKAVLQLRADDEKALRIASNSVKTFRERYLTPAAQACYWRALIRAWAEVAFEPSPWTEKDGVKVWRGIAAESFILERRLEWDPY